MMWMLVRGETLFITLLSGIIGYVSQKNNKKNLKVGQNESEVTVNSFFIKNGSPNAIAIIPTTFRSGVCVILLLLYR